MNNNNSDPVLQKGIIYIDGLTITNFDGSKTINLKGVLSQIQFTESLLHNTISGFFIVNDGLGLFDKLPLIGEEILKFSFRTTNSSAYALYNKTFAVYKIEDVAQSSDARSTGCTYKCYFASRELLKAESNNISRAYTGVYISDMVKDIYTNFILCDKTTPVDVEVTTQQQQIIIPSMSAFPAINMLATYATSSVDNYHNLFLMYENRDGFHFKNLLSLYSAPPSYEYKVAADAAFNIVGKASDSNPGDPLATPITYNFKQPADKLSAIRGGMFSNKISGIDTITKQSAKTVYDYTADFPTTQHIGSQTYPVVSDIFPYGSAIDKFVYTENYRTSSKYYSQHVPSGQTFSKSYEIFLNYRLNLLQLLSYMELELEVAGNTNITVGQIIRFKYPNLTTSDPGETVDYYTGSYLLKQIDHTFMGGKHYMKLYLIRDCLSKQIGVNSV